MDNDLKRVQVKCECGWSKEAWRPEKSLAQHKSQMHKPDMLLGTFLIGKFSEWLHKPETQKKIIQMYIESFKESKE